MQQWYAETTTGSKRPDYNNDIASGTVTALGKRKAEDNERWSRHQNWWSKLKRAGGAWPDKNRDVEDALEDFEYWFDREELVGNKLSGDVLESYHDLVEQIHYLQKDMNRMRKKACKMAQTGANK